MLVANPPADSSRAAAVHRLAAATASTSTVAVLVVLGASARRDEWDMAVLVWLAVAWTALPFIVLARAQRGHVDALPDEATTVTTIVHVRSEAVTTTRASILAAASVGPTVVVANDHDKVAALGALDVPVYVAPTIGEALSHAAHSIRSDAVLVVSGGAFADVPVVRRAAGLLRDPGVGWVIGSAVPFNRDGYAPTGRERLDQCLRHSLRAAGADVWERDATIVRTDLLRSATTVGGRPWGAWLRTWRTKGFRGSVVRATLVVWSIPVEAEAYWSDSVLRRRGVVADLADAARTRGSRARVRAAAIVVHQLYAWSFGLFLLMPVILRNHNGFPFREPAWLVALMIAAPGLGRWATLRWVHGVPLRPLRDLLGAAYDAVGSMLALPAALTRRIRPPRVGLPPRPLAWVAGALAIMMVVVIVADSSAPTRTTVAAAALAELLVLWLFGMHGVLQLLRSRATFRLRTELDVEIDGRPARASDVSPSGISTHGRLPPLPVGSTVPLTIILDDGGRLITRGVIRHREDPIESDGETTLGFELALDDRDMSRWATQLGLIARAGSGPNTHRHRQPAWQPAARSAANRARQAVAIAAVSVAAVPAAALITLHIFDYQAMVIRSGSMKPTLGIGDIVLVRHVTADQLRINDIATIDPLGDGGTTHRVVGIAEDRGQLLIETLGDANPTSEEWRLEPGHTVGRVEARLPWVGRPVTWIGSSSMRPITVIAVLVLAVASISWQRRRTNRGEVIAAGRH